MKASLFATMMAAVALFTPVESRAAPEGPWRVGDTFLIRSGKLDLDSAQGRARLYAAYARAVAEACETEFTRRATRRCEAAVRRTSEAAMPVQMRDALALAQREASPSRYASAAQQ